MCRKVNGLLWARSNRTRVLTYSDRVLASDSKCGSHASTRFLMHFPICSCKRRSSEGPLVCAYRSTVIARADPGSARGVDNFLRPSGVQCQARQRIHNHGAYASSDHNNSIRSAIFLLLCCCRAPLRCSSSYIRRLRARLFVAQALSASGRPPQTRAMKTSKASTMWNAEQQEAWECGFM